MSFPQFHFIIVWYYVAILYYASKINYASATDENIIKLKKYGPFYLTIWNWVLHLLYFSTCCFSHVVQRIPLNVPPGLKTLTRQLANYLFCALVFPLTIYVSSTFWILFAYNRELLYPKVLDTVSPPWFNHMMHTTILPIVLVELVLHHHEYPSKKVAVMSLACLLSTYGVVMTHLYFSHDVALYPLYPMLNWTQKALFLAVSVVECSVFYLLGERLTSLCWRNYNKKMCSVKKC